MAPRGVDAPLLILAFDHRGSLRDLIERSGRNADDSTIGHLKRVIFEGFRIALRDVPAHMRPGVLVDEQHGAAIARSAHQLGVVLAMPVEKTGQQEFAFEYGEAFGRHIEAFDPTFAKVLVRYNPEGDRELNARQAARLARLGDWLRERAPGYLFELLIPAERGQLASLGGDVARYDREVRPGLVLRAIDELRTSGVEPDVWKLEGLEERADYERIAALARAGGRDRVRCIVLGRGGDAAAVERWVRNSAGVAGWAGFAIGRTIWGDPLRKLLQGESTGQAAAATAIATAYRRYIEVLTEASARP